MAVNITIRDIPEEVYNKLKQQAERNNRSINSEFLYCLKSTFVSQRRDPSEIITRAKELKKRAMGSLTIEEIQEAIDRDHK